VVFADCVELLAGATISFRLAMTVLRVLDDAFCNPAFSVGAVGALDGVQQRMDTHVDILSELLASQALIATSHPVSHRL